MSSARQLPQRIVVFGATSAIASAVCRRMASQHTSFFLVARNREKLEAVRRDLIAREPAAVYTVVADLDDTSKHAQILRCAVDRLGAIDLALIAHGVLGDQQEAEREFDAAEQILHTNFLSCVSLITWLANYFESARGGVIAALSSVAGDRGRKSNYVYGASKAALNVFLDGVRNRIDRAGVQVLSIRPGFVATPMTAHMKRTALFATPDEVADGILRAIIRRKDIVYVPAFWAAIMLLIRSIPGPIFKKLDL